MTLADLTAVWSPATILAAIVAGAIVGIVLVGSLASNPAYAAKDATPLRYGLLTAVAAGAAGCAFYSLQILASYVDEDPNWRRAASRFLLWVVFSIVIGLGTWIRLVRHIARRHREAHDRAVAEIEAES